jgi:hypothetical protein
MAENTGQPERRPASAESDLTARPPQTNVLWWAGLLILLIVAAALRFTHADWDGGGQFHPDERAILFAAQEIALPRTLADLRPAASPLNPLRGPDGAPRSYTYGHLPLYANAAAIWILGVICSGQPGGLCASLPPHSFAGRLLNLGGDSHNTHLMFTGRALAAAASTATVLFTALLARRLFGAWAGLLVASFAAFSVLAIQNAHFGTVDAPLATFSTGAMWGIARHCETRQRRDALLSGAMVGLAVGTKITGMILAVPLLAASIYLQPRFRLARDHHLVEAAVAAALAFGLSNPYAVADPALYLTNTGLQLGMASGLFDWPFVRQYAGTLPVIYPVEQQARWTLGPLLTIAAYAGLVWATVCVIRDRRRDVLAAVAWAWIGLLVIGAGYAKFPRYMMPFTPTLFALAGGALVWLAERGPAWRRVAWTSGLLIMICTAAYAAGFTRMYAQPHPWIAASEWIYHHIPMGTTIAVERWDDPLPLDMAVDGTGYLRDEVYDARLLDPFAEPDDAAKLRALLSDVSEADYIILSSKRLYGTIPRLDDRYPLTAAYYRALFAGELGFKLEATFERHPNLGGWTLTDDPFSRANLTNPLLPAGARAINLGFADESFVVYDHPRALIFYNWAHYPAEELYGIIRRVADR